MLRAVSWRYLCLSVLLAGCGPKSQGDPDGSESTATSEPGGDEATTGPTSPTESEPPLDLNPDEQLCLDRCKHWQDDGDECSYFYEGCFGDCLERLEEAQGSPCEQQQRASYTCELMHPLGDSCEAVECKDVYLEEDVCRGFCYHLGGHPSQGASQEDCEWEGETCYGHDFQMLCTLGAGSQCSCKADGVEVGTCAPEVPLKAFDCGGEDMHIFTGCCTPMFLEVIG